MKQLEADVIVLSAGSGGLPAAVTAAQGGASVIIFEKLGFTVISGRMVGENALQYIKSIQ